ncbi:MAG TPA: phytanoyl-CoA dioxygenase family protein [Stellaceae bacterium]|nr:phytanoyl-CoA dioxygenase family protein [Stellaceae bacterium]
MRPASLAWLLAPVHLAALATGAKSFRDNPIIGSPSLNRAGLHVARMRLAARMAEHRRDRLASLIAAEDRSAFCRDGFVVKRDFMPAEMFAAVKQEALGYQGPAREQAQGDAITRRIALDRHALAHLPAVRSMIESAEWLGLVRYAGASWLQPQVYIQTIFAHARKAPPDPQTRLHADTFHATVKAWFFLTDTGADEGPFIYVPGSHRPTRRRLAWERRMSLDARWSADFQAARGSPRISADDLRRLGLAEPRVLAVPENTLIVADTMGFHARGIAAKRSARVEIWAYSRRNPFLPWLGWDAAAFPLIKGRAVPFYWWVQDLRERLNLGRNPWRRAGSSTALSPPIRPSGAG